jgi:hypothetical protein
MSPRRGWRVLDCGGKRSVALPVRQWMALRIRRVQEQAMVYIFHPA